MIAVASAILVAAVSLGLVLGLGVTREGDIWTKLDAVRALCPTLAAATTWSSTPLPVS